MAHRCELKLEILTHLRGACPHTDRTVTRTRAVALNIGGDQAGLLPFPDLQGHLDGYESCETEEQCTTCGEPLVRTVKHGVKENCAPDFLTVSCDPPASLLASQNLTLRFSGTCYSLCALVQWNRNAKSASVARKMEDRWWWHGIDDVQGSDYKYSAEELSNSAHLTNAAVLLLARMIVRAETFCSKKEQPEKQSGRDGGHPDIREMAGGGEQVGREQKGVDAIRAGLMAGGEDSGGFLWRREDKESDAMIEELSQGIPTNDGTGGVGSWEDKHSGRQTKKQTHH